MSNEDAQQHGMGNDSPDASLSPAEKQNPGTLLGGLLAGLIVAFTIAYGVGKMVMVLYERSIDSPMSVLWIASFVNQHDFARWMKQGLDFYQLVIAACLLLAPLVGGAIAGKVSHRSWSVTAALFGALYTVIAVAASYIAEPSFFKLELRVTSYLLAAAIVMSAVGALLVKTPPALRNTLLSRDR
jgi:hypothetical protein